MRACVYKRLFWHTLNPLSPVGGSQSGISSIPLGMGAGVGCGGGRAQCSDAATRKVDGKLLMFAFHANMVFAHMVDSTQHICSGWQEKTTTGVLIWI